MEKEFVPFNLAVKLKDLGFKRTCLAEYIDGVFYLSTSLNNKKQVLTTASAPLWQQAFDWFTSKGYHSYIEGAYPWFRYYINTESDRYEGFKHLKLEEARQSCLEKLIEIVENETI